MGETVLPVAEESSPQAEEPPICGLKEPHNTTNHNHHRQLQPKAVGDGDSPPALHAPHTLSFEEVAEALRVDTK
jgi:Na+-exporting ATPase